MAFTMWGGKPLSPQEAHLGNQSQSSLSRIHAPCPLRSWAECDWCIVGSMGVVLCLSSRLPPQFLIWQLLTELVFLDAKHFDIHYSLSPGARERRMQVVSSVASPSSDGCSLFRIVAEFCSILEFYKWHLFNGKTTGWDRNTVLSYLYLMNKSL